MDLNDTLYKLNLVKNNVNFKNIFDKAVRRMFMSNSRLALKSLLQNDDAVRNSYFDDKDIDELRQAVFNREFDLKNRKLDSSDNRSREISYENYRPLTIDGRYAGMAPFISWDMATRVNKYKDNKHNYNMQTSIGSARYKIEPDGTVKLYDKYDVNRGTHINNKLLYIPHEIIKRFGKSYNINLDLGNINDWNKVYTGNSVYDYR